MTERVRTLTVYLASEKRIDDAEVVMDAIRMIKGVHDVQPGEDDDGHRYAIRAVRSDFGDGIRACLRAVLYPELLHERDLEAIRSVLRKAEKHAR